MKDFIISGGRLFDGQAFSPLDLEVRDGRIAAWHHAGKRSGLPRVEAEGGWILPGFMDVHVHVDDVIAGYVLADTWESASRIALMNGITSLFSFITQGAGEDLYQSIRTARDKAQRGSHCDYGWHLTPRPGADPDLSELQSACDAGIHSLKFYTTYREAGIYFSYEEISRIASAVHGRNIRILVHCEDDSVLGDLKDLYPQPEKPQYHSLLRPEEAELEAVRAIIRIARESGAKFHVVHVSTDRAALELEKASRTLDITFETCPQYLFFNNEFLALPGGTRYLCTPPLRHEKTRRTLAELAKSGRIPLFATDHCAFSTADKDWHAGDWPRVPNGLAGLGALLPMIARLHGEMNDRSMVFLQEHLSAASARMTGTWPRKGSLAVGADADIVLLRPASAPRNVLSTLSDSPQLYADQTHPLQVDRVYQRGRLMVLDNQFVFDGPAAGLEI